MRVDLGCPVVFALWGLALTATAQEPVINGATPGAVLPGQPTTVLLQGGNLAGIKGVWTSFPAQAVVANLAENGTKPDQVVIEVTPGSDVAVGLHGLRVWTDTGVSPLKLLLVDDLPTTAQAGNNTSFATAQAITLPTAVEGNVAGLTTQFFKVTVAEGQTLSLEVLARRIGSPLDPMLRLLDARGRELAFSDDAPGLAGDSQISHKFAQAGDYVVELRDIRYQGGAYRLRIGDFPCVSTPYPLAIPRGQATAVTLAGLDVAGLEPITITAPADPTISSWPVSLKRAGGQSSGFGQVSLVDRPQFLETEPNNAPEAANRVELSHDINGRFDQRGDVDRYVLKPPAGSTWVFAGITRDQGSPSDLQFKLLKADGNPLAMIDDTGVDEGWAKVTFPEEADYTLVVNDLAMRGGPDYSYRIAIKPYAPGFQLALSTDTFNIPAGGSVFATVTATRFDYGGPIELSVAGLPEGVTASRSVIGPGRNDAVLTLTAGPTYTPGQWHAIRVVGTAADGATTATADFAAPLKTRWSNMRYVPANLKTTAAAAPTAAPGFVCTAEPAEVVFGKQLGTTTKVRVTRAAGFDEAVAMTLQPAQNGLPPGIAVAVKNIDKGAGEVDLAISADDKAPLGDFTIGLLGTLKQGDKTVVQPLAIRLSLAEPLKVSAAVGEGKLPAGGELVVKVDVARNPAATGPVEVAFVNLPAGVTAAATTIPADQSTAEIKLTAAADAAKGAATTVQVKTTLTVGSAKFEVSSANLTVTVE